MTKIIQTGQFFKNKPFFIPEKLYRVIGLRANPRSHSYMQALMKSHAISGDEVTLDHVKKDDSVMLIYPDSIGLGYSWAEYQLFFKTRNITVLNGRGRVFKLTFTAWLGLIFRRFLEITFLPEILVMPFLLIYMAVITLLINGITRVMTQQNKKEIQNWWAENPMTYGTVHGQTAFEDERHVLGTRDFFQRLDEEFYSWNKPLHDQKPFDRLFPYKAYQGKKVLEIGCGLGTMLMNWAQHGAHVTGVDLNPTSVDQTKKRFELFGLTGDIQSADANSLPFADNSFDYVWSWGVLHHSPHMDVSLNEMFRALKPGGGFGLMLYNRRSLYSAYIIEYIEGFLHREHRFLSPLELHSRYGDGHRQEGNPHTWPVTKGEIEQILKPIVSDIQTRILGTDLDSVLPSLLPMIGRRLPRPMVKALARRWGWSLWFNGQKKA